MSGTLRATTGYQKQTTAEGDPMATFTFSLSTSDKTRQAGLIQSTSFHEALNLVGERMPVTRGDTLEIGVQGFPPARYECIESLLDGTVHWEPMRLAA